MMAAGCAIQVEGNSFSAQQICEYVGSGGLLSIENLLSDQYVCHVAPKPAHAGQLLNTRIRKVARLEDLGIAQGHICNEANELMAFAEIKVWTSSKELP